MRDSYDHVGVESSHLRESEAFSRPDDLLILTMKTQALEALLTSVGPTMQAGNAEAFPILKI